MKTQNITLEQSLQAYRVMNTPSKLSWKQHWALEKFSHNDVLKCSDEERKQFSKRLEECAVTICDNIKHTQGQPKALTDIIKIIVSPLNKNISKANRKVVYSTSNGERPIGKKAFELWNGLQIIDLDIKDDKLVEPIKKLIFEKLNKCNWFLCVTKSSSGRGLHVYTKISIPESEVNDFNKKRLLYLTNFRHKYSFVYIALLSGMDKLGYSKENILKWMDLAMFKPQQGAFIGYDSHPLINSGFFEDFIYVNFDNVEDIGHPDIDWVTYPDLKEIFKRWEYFEDDSDDDINIKVIDAAELSFDTHNKVHYKHFERWKLANTLVQIYGLEKGYKYLRTICSNNIKDKELQADCITASRHNKPVNIWAVNRLNSVHGFKIKLNIQDNAFDESEIFNSIDKIDNPTLIKESSILKIFHINKDQYLGHIRYDLFKNIGRITLIEAGAGVGKTEMIKQLVKDGKKVMMVMPFTSTIKSKVENEKDWEYSYGNRKPKLNCIGGLALTIDKFSKLNMMDIKSSGFDYIIIDESHLMFQSEYRPVMAKVVEMVRNTEVPVIFMSGTPSGEIVFFPDIVHLKVIKDDTRKKEFNVNIVDNSSILMYQMCKNMAKDIMDGKRILFPSNRGTLFSEQIKACVTYFLQNDYANFNEVKLLYYKKSNLGEQFMDDVNFKKTIKDTQILMCSNYLSVGVDILDRFNFSIYFDDLMMPQEVEQFANRLRSNDLYIKLYIAKKDHEGNSRNIHTYREMNFKLNEEEIKNVHAILRLCNSMIERNPVEYKYNSIISSIITNNKFIEYNDIENRYYLNEIAYKLIYFERKYRDYVQQLPVLMKGMMSYGYNVSAIDLKDSFLEGSENFKDLATMVKIAYDEKLNLNTTHIEELMDLITEDRLILYKDVMSGDFEIRKGSTWKEDIAAHKMIVKNIEVFEKVVPIFTSMSKQYDVKTIKEIFEYCRDARGRFNFAAINRIKLLINILYSDKNKRLDLPIKEFMEETYKFSEKKQVTKEEIKRFLSDFTQQYAIKESSKEINILLANVTLETLNKTFEKIFKCLVHMSRPKRGRIDIERVELLWKEKEYYNSENQNDKVFALTEFLS